MLPTRAIIQQNAIVHFCRRCPNLGEKKLVGIFIGFKADYVYTPMNDYTRILKMKTYNGMYTKE